MALNGDQAFDGYRLPDDYLSFADEFLPPVKERIVGTFVSTWDIDNWSSLSESKVIGPSFKTLDHTWHVILYPNGKNETNQVSLYLTSEDVKNGTSTSDICAQVILCMVDPIDSVRHFRQGFNHRFCKEESNWGYNSFMDLNSMLEGEETVVVQNAVKIISIVRLIEDSTGVLWHKYYNYNSKDMTGHVGLFNQGATCYMNSLFQSLFFTNLYRKAVYQIPTENDDPNNSSVLALQRLFYNLQFSDTAVSTTELTTSFGWNSVDSFMQHDVQEFNRILQDNIEKKMTNTPAHDAIKKLFVGKMKSYIKCINVDYESSRTEEYYDIQLNVKGCKNLEESFQTYISEETLEGDNKYMATEHGLQDAKKGVIFDHFPPVLHLQLKRFEYDMLADSMVKINDRHEFPSEIDLEPFLSDSADKTLPHKYMLHSVLVHTGDLTCGHYFAFVRPSKEEKWYKFDDDRVTHASLQEVFEANFGGDALLQPIHTSAYMLVYVRQSHQDDVLAPVTEADIPRHLVERINQEHLFNAMVEKQRSEQHLYMKVYVANLDSFWANWGTGFINFVENVPIDPPIVQIKHVLRNAPLRTVLQAYSFEKNIDIRYLRLWNLANRYNGWVQLDILFSDEDLDLSVETVCQRISDHPSLRLFVEHARTDSDGLYWFPPLQMDWILVFIKLFDPVTRTLRPLGNLYIPKHGLVSDTMDEILTTYNILDRDMGIDIYEEDGPGLAQKLKVHMRFNDYGIENGDILIIQKKVSQTNDFTVVDYVDFLNNQIPVLFEYKQELGSLTTLTLSKKMLYSDITLQLSTLIGWDPEKIILILPDVYGRPGRDVKTVAGMTLLDILLLIPRNTVNKKLYYDTLPISLSEYESMKLIQINICRPTLNQIQYHEQLLPKKGTITDLARSLHLDQPIRVFSAKNGKLERVYKSKEIISNNNDQLVLYAEIVPKEEQYVGEEQGFFISVYHYQKELTQTHSVPFKFLVIKDEAFDITKRRLQARCGLDDEAWNKVRFHIVKGFTTKTINQDDYKLSDHCFKDDEMLGLEHIDPLGRYNISMTDKGLHIKD